MGWITIAVIVIFVILLVRGNLYERLQSLEWRFWRASGLAARESSPTLGSLPVAATYKPTDGLRCGACGYSVRGATGLTCSECGADYRVVGMKSGDSAKSLGALPIAIIWGIALLIIANPINNAVQRAMYVHRVQITSRAEYMAVSRAFSFGIAVDIDDWQGSGAKPLTPSTYSDRSAITLTLTGPMGKGVTLLLHPGQERYEMAGPDGKHIVQQGWPTHDTLRECLESIGVDTTDAARADEIETVVNVATRYRSGMFADAQDVPSPTYEGGDIRSRVDRTPMVFFDNRQYSRSSSTAASGTPPWVIIGLRVFWLTLWILGIITVQRRLRWK